MWQFHWKRVKFIRNNSYYLIILKGLSRLRFLYWDFLLRLEWIKDKNYLASHLHIILRSYGESKFQCTHWVQFYINKKLLRFIDPFPWNSLSPNAEVNNSLIHAAYLPIVQRLVGTSLKNKKARRPVSRNVHRVPFSGNLLLNQFWWEWISVNILYH